MPIKARSEALASHWQQHIEAWQSSGQTQQAYCKTHTLSYHRFGYWRHKLHQPSPEDKRQQESGFVPVTHSALPQPEGLSLAFPSGLILRGITGNNVSVVYQLLSRLT